ncbi:MAG: hypothetical protein MAGBODY4_00700 [Candidatus Marinimicrobia bacterium]|nr:hypothetical protein [Candidatus Neomarinimicrobiota bacterium]
MTIITAPKPLREKPGDDGADALVDLFNQSEQRQKEDVLEFVEEKFERRLSEELSKFRIEMNERFTAVDKRFVSVNEQFASINERFAEVDTKFVQVEAKIESTKSYMVRWMFAF